MTPVFVAPLAFNDPRWAVATLLVSFGLVLAAGALASRAKLWGLGAILLVMSALLWAVMLPEREAVWQAGPLHASPTSLA